MQGEKGLAMLAERMLDTGTVSINYAEGPKSGPTLVLVHGIAARWQVFRPIIPTLAARWHIVAMDLRGHGRSGHVAGGYSVLEYASDALALIRHVDVGPVSVIGHSLGAVVGIALASEHPAAVSALVLEDPPLGAFAGRPSYDRPGWAALIATRDLIRGNPALDDIVRVLTEQSPEQSPEIVRDRALHLSRLDPDALSQIIENRAIKHFDLPERLRGVTCPTLLLQGNPERGGALSAVDASSALSLIPVARHVLMPDVGHGLHSDENGQPDRVCALIAEFLASL